MKLFTQTVILQSARTKDEVLNSLRTQLSVRKNRKLEYNGTVYPNGSFTARPNPPQGIRGRGAMPLLYGYTEETGPTCRVHATFHFPPMVAVVLLLAEVVTLTVALLMYMRVIAFGNFPLPVLPVFAFITPFLFYGTYRYEVHNAIASLKSVVL